MTSYDKALKINLDTCKYGVFAEIGAGQEVANWFFKASATAGTVAKSISAYDMTMSDSLYGKSQRYVSRARVQSMLDHEYELLKERLSEKRGEKTTFFSFCNKVRARGYKDSGECHGWMGLRLQLVPEQEPCDILCHVRLLDEVNTDQMDALGVIGLNLIYAGFYHRDNMSDFISSLVDNLTQGRVEIDMVKFEGAGFDSIGNRLCSLQLVRSGLTNAAIFMPDGEVVQPAEVLYKKPVILLRGSFSPVTHVHLDMLEQAKSEFEEKWGEELSTKALSLCEISLHNLLRYDEEGEMKDEDFLQRVDILQSLGQAVLISSYSEFHRVGSYLSLYTKEPIAIVLSIGILNELFKEKWVESLPGGILESFGRLFKNEVALYVYPWKNRKTDELVTATNFEVEKKFSHLYQYLLQNNRIQGIEYCCEDRLKFTGRDIMKMVKEENPEWKRLIPEEGHKILLRRNGS